ncbi:MAG: zinc ribbon domain-containing protein [bacterium]|nr:zinc ribbon domain-containing protein [bacterium]
MDTIKCRECGRELSSKATICPHCGIMYPGNPSWKGWGVDKKSEKIIGGMPLYHVSFGVDEKGKLRRARGIIAVGQFAQGYIVLAQFGAAYILGFGQFIISPLSVAQFALGIITLGQLSVGVVSIGQFAVGLYSLCQAGVAARILSIERKDPEAIEFFRILTDYIKKLF